MSMAARNALAAQKPCGVCVRFPMLIFSSRWLQLPLYLGLIVAQGVYVVLFLKELWHLCSWRHRSSPSSRSCWSCSV